MTQAPCTTLPTTMHVVVWRYVTLLRIYTHPSCLPSLLIRLSTAFLQETVMRLLASLGVISLASVCFSASTTEDTSTVVNLGYAQYRGNRSNEQTVAFLGLPYAEPPVGELRWRVPLPLNTTRVQAQAAGRVVDATSYPEFCIQGTTGSTSHFSHAWNQSSSADALWSRWRRRGRRLRGLPQSECLRAVRREKGRQPYVSAFCLSSDHSISLHNPVPVLVYIHGGGVSSPRRSPSPCVSNPHDTNPQATSSATPPTGRSTTGSPSPPTSSSSPSTTASTPSASSRTRPSPRPPLPRSPPRARRPRSGTSTPASSTRPSRSAGCRSTSPRSAATRVR
jgi:hypothetical protein